MDVRYPELYATLETWLRSALPVLKDRIAANPLETRNEHIWAIRLLSESLDPVSPIRATDETRMLAAALDGIPGFAQDAITEERWHSDPTLPQIQASRKIGQFIYAYLGDSLDWSFDHDRYRALYPDLEQLLHHEASIDVTTQIELWGVKSDCDPIQLEEGVAVRQLTTGERERSIASSRASMRFGDPRRFEQFDHEIPTPALCLEIKRSLGQDLNKDGSLADEISHIGTMGVWELGHALLLGLRLLAAGDFGIGLVKTSCNNRLLSPKEPFSTSVARQWPTPDPKRLKRKTGRLPRPWQRPQRDFMLASAWASHYQNLPWGAPTVLDKPLATELQRLWPLLRAKPDSRLEPAFHRFELSYDRIDPEDRILDYWIAFESLFLSDGSKDNQLKRAASQRLAYYIEAEGSKRLDVYRAAKKSYDFRSDIVHGNVYDPAEVEDSANEVSGYLRRTLLRCLASNKPPGNDVLDEDMMSR